MSERFFGLRWMPIAGVGSIVIFALLVSGCDKGVPTTVAAGKTAPDVSGDDVQGKKIQLKDYQGKVVLLDFWATWCGPCVASIPKEIEMMRANSKRPFTILGICCDQQTNLKDFLAKRDLPWPNIVDPSASIANTWGVYGFPTWILIDHQGLIQGRWVGGQDIAEVEAAVEKAVQIAEKKDK